jgi:hypothetical protein
MTQLLLFPFFSIICRIVDCKVVEKELGVYDELDFLKQLGVVEYTEKRKELIPEHSNKPKHK